MKKKVLIIEDDNFIASLMIEGLKKSGFDFDVDLAFNGEEGLKKIEEKIPDLILLDIILPGIGGFEILEKLKNEEKTKQIPVIIVSNLGSQDEIQKGLKLGAISYFIKAHILPDELAREVDKVLKEKS